jgi:hypothetical protein
VDCGFKRLHVGVEKVHVLGEIFLIVFNIKGEQRILSKKFLSTLYNYANFWEICGRFNFWICWEVYKRGLYRSIIVGKEDIFGFIKSIMNFLCLHDRCFRKKLNLFQAV